MAGLGAVVDALAGRYQVALQGRCHADGEPVCVLVSGSTGHPRQMTGNAPGVRHRMEAGLGGRQTFDRATLAEVTSRTRTWSSRGSPESSSYWPGQLTRKRTSIVSDQPREQDLVR